MRVPGVSKSTRAAVATLVSVLSAFLVASIGIAGWQDYKASVSKVEIRAAGAAKVLELELLWLIGATDMTLGRAADLADQPDAKLLARLAGQLPGGAILSVFDAQGRLVLETEPIEHLATGEVLSRLVAEGADKGFSTIRKAPDGKRYFVVARVLRQDGVVAGLVTACIPVDRILRLTEDMDLGRDAAIAVLRDDGTLVMRDPEPSLPQSADRVRGARLFSRVVEAAEGVYRSTSVIDGVDRIVAYRRIPELGLIVVVAPSVEYALADLHVRLKRLAFFAVPATVLVLALGLLAAWTMMKESQARDEARAVKKNKLHFIAATYHDLGQILLVLDLFLGRLRQSASGAQREALDGADTAVRSIHDLLDTLTDQSRLAAGGVEVVPGPVPVRALLDRIAAEVEPRATQKGLSLRVGGMEMEAWSDPHLLERIVRNLVVNAIKFTEKGGVLLGCRRVGNSVSIEVWDTGPGIPEAEREIIFTAFHRIGRPHPARGLGLGLSIVSRFSAMLGHSVTLHSRVGRGSVFKVRAVRAP